MRYMQQAGVFETFPPTTPDIWHTQRLAGEIQGPASFPITWGSIPVRGWMLVDDTDPTNKRYCIMDMMKSGDKPEDSVPLSSQFDYQNVPMISYPKPADPSSLANRVAVLARIGWRIDQDPRWQRSCTTQGFGMIPQNIPNDMDITEMQAIESCQQSWTDYATLRMRNPPDLDQLKYLRAGHAHVATH